MINKIIKIGDISVIDQDVNDNLYTLSLINYDENELGSGTFGSVYKVHSIDGKITNKYVLKIFSLEESQDKAYTVIETLHKKIKRTQISSKVPIYYKYPELMGLPFMIFKGYDEIRNVNVVAFLMFDLLEMGYVDYGVDHSDISEISALNPEDKLLLSFQFSKVISYLHDINFLHCDLKPSSLFINPKTKNLALIDYDGGFHVGEQKKGLTFGSISHWLSRKWNKYIRERKKGDEISIKEHINEEKWWLANGLFQILFGVIPYFFLKDADDKTKLIYLKSNKWPKANYDLDSFNLEIKENYIYFLNIYNQLRNAGLDHLFNVFELTFNEGYKDENIRLESVEWKNIYLNILQGKFKPVINEFSVSKKVINKKGEEIVINWSVYNGNEIYLNDELQDYSIHSKNIKLDDSKILKLLVKNDFGSIEKNISINANKEDPQITFYSSSDIRKSLSPIKLSWEVKNAQYVLITDGDHRYKAIDNLYVYPDERKEYTLTAIGNFEQKIEKKLILDVIQPKIESFTYKVNILKGLKNVDLTWKVKDAVSLSIDNGIGIVTNSKIVHKDIEERTRFVLKAEGLFGVTEADLIAEPFPLPIVKELMTQVPNININTKLKVVKPIISDELLKSKTIKFTNNVIVRNCRIEYNTLNKDDFFKTKRIDFHKSNIELDNFPSFTRINNKSKLYKTKHSLIDVFYKNIKKWITKM